MIRLPLLHKNADMQALATKLGDNIKMAAWDYRYYSEKVRKEKYDYVKVWEVTDKTTGQHIGLWYLDPFARQGVRNAVDPAETYRAFRGCDAKIDALMRDRGFPLPPAK